MKYRNVPSEMLVVLFKERSQYPAKALTDDRRIISGRDTWFDPKIIGWLIPKEEVTA